MESITPSGAYNLSMEACKGRLSKISDLLVIAFPSSDPEGSQLLASRMLWCGAEARSLGYRDTHRCLILSTFVHFARQVRRVPGIAFVFMLQSSHRAVVICTNNTFQTCFSVLAIISEFLKRFWCKWKEMGKESKSHSASRLIHIHRNWESYLVSRRTPSLLFLDHSPSHKANLNTNWNNV